MYGFLSVDRSVYEVIVPYESLMTDPESDNPDTTDADHITIRERGAMKLRDCMACHRTAALNSGEPIDHADDCPHALEDGSDSA